MDIRNQNKNDDFITNNGKAHKTMLAKFLIEAFEKIVLKYKASGL